MSSFLRPGFAVRWTAAYAVGELLGLGILGVVFSHSQEADLGTRAALAIAAGVLEGLIVGALLGAVLRSAHPEVRWRRWVAATVAGATCGWALGTLPSLWFGRAGGGDEPALVWKMAAAALLGACAGPLLAVFQARVLRPLGVRPFAWAAANALGWSVGMPLVFLAADSAWTNLAIAVRGTLLLALAGGAVGLATARVLARGSAA